MTMTSEQSYVRTEMLGEKAPPSTSVGIVGWMRENLFSSWLNAILSLLAIFAAYSVLSALLPWIFGGIWNASSLNECRAKLIEIHGESTNRACWGVIHERFWQLMYGFYPTDLGPSWLPAYWRPNLALIMLFAAIAPVLFNGLPKKMLLISV
ncbi:MAG: amino acid ABC transporter permease, partial [Marinosulfonomonas sp.]|nr:amino acid ABC transporter permease [Marinosulfonomonas sp.]